MLNQILTLELCNDKGLKSLTNLRKLFLSYGLPNISAFLMATVIGVQTFYEVKSIILLVLGLNIFSTIVVQYIAQKNILGNLEKEALLKFLPTKIPQFVKIRLFLFIMKLYFPVLLFSTVLLSFFIEENYFVLMVLMISSVFIINLQICLSILIRYYMNTLRRLPLQILQVGLLLIFTVCGSLYILFGTILLLEMLEDLLDNIVYAQLSIDSLYVFSTVFVIAIISIVLKLIIDRLHLNVLFHNRNLGFELKTAMAEKAHWKIYGLFLSKTQKVLFEKDIKHVMRDSKVMLFVLGLNHLVIFGIMIFPLFMVTEINENDIFIIKLFFMFMIGQMILMGLISMGNKDFTSSESDFDVVEGYHITLPKRGIIDVKVKLLKAFVFPKLTVIYAILMIKVLIMNEYTLALLVLFNYIQCYLFAKTWGLWIVKEANKMNSQNQILYFVNAGLIMAFLIVLMQAFNGTIENLFLFQILLLGMLALLYCFHLFVFKDNNKYKTDQEGLDVRS